MNEWFEIFRSGTHTDSMGRTMTWTNEDLDKIVANYNPEESEAPIVIGHPKTNHPAWGWIAALKRVGDRLLALPKQVVPEFAEMVQKGMFKKRSISIDPEQHRLIHVGFLGAVPPAVKGLKDIEFRTGEEVSEYALDMEDVETKLNVVARIFQLLRDFLIEKFGREEAASIIRPWEIDELLNKGEGRINLSTQITNEEDDDMTQTELQARIEALENENRQLQERLQSITEQAQQYQQQLTERERARRREELSAFCDELVKNGRITEAQKNNIVTVLESLSDAPDVSFAEGEQRQPAEVLREFLRSLPEQLVMREFATGDNREEDEDSAEPHEYSGKVDETRLELRNKAVVLMKKERISFGEAVRKVLQEQ
jgi:hypothetical protein